MFAPTAFSTLARTDAMPYPVTPEGPGMGITAGSALLLNREMVSSIYSAMSSVM